MTLPKISYSRIGTILSLHRVVERIKWHNCVRMFCKLLKNSIAFRCYHCLRLCFIYSLYQQTLIRPNKPVKIALFVVRTQSREALRQLPIWCIFPHLPPSHSTLVIRRLEFLSYSAFPKLYHPWRKEIFIRFSIPAVCALDCLDSYPNVSLTVRPQTSYWTSLGLTLLLYKVEITTERTL